MVTGRVLFVHESAGTRALLADLLAREGLRVEAVDSTHACMDRFVDEPADLVLVGLADVHEQELELIPALKKEEPAPRVLVTFPGPRREMAVHALRKGADGYVLEPFYPEELVGVVRGQLAARETGRYYALAELAREVAHAVNNPLQVVELLLAKENVTKRDLLRAIPEQTARIEAVVRHLREYSAIPTPRPEARDAGPLVEAAGIELAPGRAPPRVRVDPASYLEALKAVREAIAARGGPGLKGELVAEADAVVLRCPAPAEAFAGENVATLLDSVFVVTPDRQVLPGLARARALLESQRGSLTVERGDRGTTLVARVPLA